MTSKSSLIDLEGRRAELLVELFFQELGSLFVAQPSAADFGYDLFVGFRNTRGGINFAAVEIKATSRPVKAQFPIPHSRFAFWVNCNIPVLLVVVDSKNNELHWAQVADRSGQILRPGSNIQIRLRTVQTSRSDLLRVLQE